MKLPKLHLRDLFWLVLVCACLCAWLHANASLQTSWKHRSCAK